jgi:cyclopropane fatty-acyl-phospholipid synthase-like methyltransferase
MSDDEATVLVDRYRRAAVTNSFPTYYKGLGIHALPGLHDFIGAKIIEYFRPGTSVLDLAAGTGAMSVRMHDLGFVVTATDYVPENFRATSIPFLKIDLNGFFGSEFDHAFDALVASEIIEHLENPRHFARECSKLLSPGGRLLVSTPNVENPRSKAMFVRSGTFNWFTDRDYDGHGHISPLTHSQLDKIFSEAGFRFVWRGSFGPGLTRSGMLSRAGLFAALVKLVSSIDGELDKEIFVAVLEKP